MNHEIIAFEIEIRKEKHESFEFNNTTLQAMLAGLNVVYNEVFIWSEGNHVAVWVVGKGAELVEATFKHHQHHYVKTQITRQTEAVTLFKNIVSGKKWQDCTIKNKYKAFENGLDLSGKLNALGSILTPLIEEGFAVLRTHSVFATSEQNENKESRKASLVSVRNRNHFYRLGIN